MRLHGGERIGDLLRMAVIFRPRSAKHILEKALSGPPECAEYQPERSPKVAELLVRASLRSVREGAAEPLGSSLGPARADALWRGSQVLHWGIEPAKRDRELVRHLG